MPPETRPLIYCRNRRWGVFADKNIKAILEPSFAKDPAKTLNESYVEVYRRLRDGGMVAPSHAREFVDSVFSSEKYDLSEVGRYNFNNRFKRSLEKKDLALRLITEEDIKIIMNIKNILLNIVLIIGMNLIKPDINKTISKKLGAINIKSLVFSFVFKYK